MSDFIKEKLSVDINSSLENLKDIKDRLYTLIHSDDTGDLFLFIDTKYREDKFSLHRDEVIACWKEVGNKYILEVSLYVGGNDEFNNIEKRDVIFREELPLALKAILYGDKKIFLENKDLTNASIIVKFNSKDRSYNKVERWGEVSDYLISKDRIESSFKFTPNMLNPRIKDGVIFTLLNSYIEKEMKKIYGAKYVYCPNFSEILSIKSLNAPLACKGRYIVVVRVKSSGLSNKPINESIIEFLISTEGVKVQSVKNPR